MLKIRILPALILIVLVSSCSTLNRMEISNPDKIEFEPLKLEPSLESTELRIDLIRQSVDNKVNDSTTVSEDSDYHPLGFDLGNGIFYDLNGNLSFRLDELLGLVNLDCWKVEQTNRRRQWWGDCLYSFCGDTLSITYPPGRTKRYVNHRVTEGGTTSVMRRKRLLYAVDMDNESAVYRYKWRKLDVIRKMEENSYTLKKGFWKENFELQRNRVILARDFFIELSDDHKKIRIKRPGLFTSRVVYTIEKNTESIFIYGRNFQGKKIKYTDTGLEVYQNRVFVTGWKL